MAMPILASAGAAFRAPEVSWIVCVFPRPASPRGETMADFSPGHQFGLSFIEISEASGNLGIPGSLDALVYLIVEAIDEGPRKSGPGFWRKFQSVS